MKKAFDIIAAIKRNGQLGQFFGRESGPLNVVAAAIQAIRAIIRAVIGKKNLKQGIGGWFVLMIASGVWKR